MTKTRRRWLQLLPVAVMLWPMSAEAQPAARSFEELMGILTPGETIVVADVKGRKVKGVLTAIDQMGLSLFARGRMQTFAQTDIGTVRRPDGLGNGALLGAGAGAGAALTILGILGNGDGYVLPSAKAGAPLLLSGIGVVVGVLLDRAHEGGPVLYASGSYPQR